MTQVMRDRGPHEGVPRLPRRRRRRPRPSPRARVHALVGPNGAGKTTLFNLLTGFLKPTAGRIVLRDRGPHRPPPGAGGAARRRAVVPDHQPLPAAHAARARRARAAEPDGARAGGSGARTGSWTGSPSGPLELLDDVGLGRAPRRPGRRTLPYGRKRALELALGLALDPAVLLLDEPTAGMGTEDVDRTVELIRRIRTGRTVVMVEHNMSVVSRLADHVTVLQSGRVLVEGPYAEIRQDPRVVSAYLGRRPRRRGTTTRTARTGRPRRRTDAGGDRC